MVAELAARQHGVVQRGQLTALGLGSRAIDHRVEGGRLHVAHRGVYAVGHRLLTREGRWMVAVLAGGPGAALSHRAAAALWGVRRSERRRIDITVAAKRGPRPEIELHRSLLAADEVTTVSGIAVTTVPRTLLDLAAVVDRHQLARAVNEAELLRLWDPVSLAALLERHPRRRGAVAIRAALEEGRQGPSVTRSELEDRFLAFLADRQLPRPQTNLSLRVGYGTIEVDFAWRAQRVVAELDGHAVHSTRAAYESDRERDRLLQAEGWRVVRVTWRQLSAAPEALARDLTRILLTA